MKFLTPSVFLLLVQPSVASLRGTGRDLEEIPSLFGESHHIVLDPKTVSLKADFPQAASPIAEESSPLGEEAPAAGGSPAVMATNKSRRKFVRYESSKLEKLWLNNVDRWAQLHGICDALNSEEQMPLLHDFLALTCSAYYAAPYDSWCIIDDDYQPLWYNTAERSSFQVSWVNPVPDDVPLSGPYKPVVPGPEHEHVVSKFVFEDETTGETYYEYIEPLVSHLRFPLSHCTTFEPTEEGKTIKKYHWHMMTFRGWIIPPPPELRVNKKLYWDAGASDWSHGKGGPSLSFFYNYWQRQGHVFDHIYAYEMTTPVPEFYQTVPKDVRDRVHYEQVAVVSRPQDEEPGHPFIPNAIKRQATAQDYILFKLDIDSPVIEQGTIDFILSDDNNFISEVVWEHHIAGNYLMAGHEWGDFKHQAQVTLRESYDLFLQMRLKGIRAHSWI